MVTARAPTILCVDDKAGTLEIRKHLLEQAGYFVLPAAGAPTALKLFKSQIIDLVISDHLLPDFTGAELTGEMKRQRPFVPVMIYSAVIDAPRGTEHVDLFISKAGGPSELLEKVADLLRPNRIAGGNYFAEIRCDRRVYPCVWHYTVQRLRSPEIVAWCQADTEKEAIRDARRALRESNEPMEKTPEMEFDPEAFERALHPNSKEKARLSEALENERTARETEKAKRTPR